MQKYFRLGIYAGFNLGKLDKKKIHGEIDIKK
jgi:hypothetical protein